MRSTVQVGRVVGIPVGLHWSLLLIGVAMAVEVRQSFAESGTVGATGLIAAVVLVVAFYAGLVAHELGHAMTARRAGVETIEITLWMLGGIARLAQDTPTPAAEAKMAIAGPVVSAFLAGAWSLVGWGCNRLVGADSGVRRGMDPGSAEPRAPAFNLVPAFPLDGGRVLGAGLWAWRGDRVRGTNAAASVGLAIGAVAVGGGAMLAGVGADLLSGLWFALLGVFVIRAGWAEAAFVREAVADAENTAGARCHRPPVLDPTMSADEMLSRWPLDAEHHT